MERNLTKNKIKALDKVFSDVMPCSVKTLEHTYQSKFPLATDREIRRFVFAWVSPPPIFFNFNKFNSILFKAICTH
jgi:hypothetical protein